MPTATVINKHILINPAPPKGDRLPVDRGVVMATDNSDTCPVNPGQMVIFDRNGGPSQIDMGGEKLLVIKEEDIIIVLHVSAADRAAQSQAKREAEASVAEIADPTAEDSEEDCS